MRDLAFALVLVCGSARADQQPSAQQLYRDGQVAYDQERFDDALVAWQHSFELSHLQALRFNLGQAYRRRGHAGDCALAREQYQAFLADAAPSPHRELAERYVAELATCAAGPTRAVQAPQPTATIAAASPTAGSSNRRLAAIGVGGAGIVLFASGIYLGAHARTLGDDVTSACGPPVGCVWAIEESKDAAGRRDTTLGYAFDAIGVAAVLGAAAYYWFGVHAREAPAVSVQARVGGAIVAWEHAW
jgi:hypothetical protein